MPNPINVAILGVSGRMGRALLGALDEVPELALSGASASAGSQWVGKDAGAPHGAAQRAVLIAPDAAGAIEHADVAIDFTLPAATPANVAACVAASCPLVIGTTGHAEPALAQIAQAAQRIAIVLAPNMSLGVNLLLKLTELASRVLNADYDIEVFEAHHRHKKDAPSGTALALGRAAAQGRGVVFEEIMEHHNSTGKARRRGAIGFCVFRGGDVVGDHTVTFAGMGERIELTHRATDRLAFARGAVRAAHWLIGRPPGLYSMQDVLGNF